jgi:hypothetical protein
VDDSRGLCRITECLWEVVCPTVEFFLASILKVARAPHLPIVFEIHSLSSEALVESFSMVTFSSCDSK